MIPAYLSLQNPLDLSDIPARGGDARDKLIKKLKLAGFSDDAMSEMNRSLPYDSTIYQVLNSETDRGHHGTLVRELQRLGHDGIRFNDTIGPLKSSTFVAFKPNQIKSATGNIGTFDPQNADVRYQMKPGPRSKAYELLREHLQKLKEAEEAAKVTPETTGTKNAKMDELRERAGLGDEPESEVTPPDEFMDEARREIAANPRYAPDLAEKVASTGRATTAKEDAALQLYLRDLENRRQAGEDVRAAQIEAGVANKRSGTRWHEWGMTRQTELAADFSAAGILRKHLDAVGVENPPSEEQMAKYEKMADEIAKQEAELEELRKRKTDEEIDKLIEDAKKRVEKPKPEKKGTKKERLQRQASEAVVSFKSAWDDALKATGGVFTSGGLNPEAIGALGRAAKAAAGVVKAYAELGVTSFLEFAANLKRDIGELTAEQSKLFRDEWDKEFGKAPSPLGPNPTDPMIGVAARQLTRWAVESGITDREEVIDAVHAELTRYGLELTRSETMRAMSGYGDFRELPMDTVSVTVRGIKGEIQQLLKLEAMRAGQAPEKTGVERREPTEDERQLIKDVNEAKKRGGYTVTDPKRQLKSALDTAKTTAEHALKDTDLAIEALEQAIRDRTPLAKPDGRTPGPTDAKLDEMRAQLAEKRATRKSLRAEYDKIFPKQRGPLSDARRLKMAEALLTRLNDQLEADIAAGNILDKEKKAPLTSPILEEQRKRRDELKQALKEAREGSPEYQSQQEAKENARRLESLRKQEAFWTKTTERGEARHTSTEAHEEASR